MHQIVTWAILDPHAVPAVPQVHCTINIGADVVAADDVAQRATVEYGHSVAVATDEVALLGRIAADNVVLGAVNNHHPVPCVADDRRARDVRADKVAADGVAHGAGALNQQAVLIVAADEVSLSLSGSTNRIMPAAIGDEYAPLISLGNSAAEIGADVVATDRVTHRAGAMDADTIPGVAANQVALAHWPNAHGPIATDGVVLRAITHGNAVSWEVEDLQTPHPVAIGVDPHAVGPDLRMVMVQFDGDAHRLAGQGLSDDCLRPICRPVEAPTADFLLVAVRIQNSKFGARAGILIPEAQLGRAATRGRYPDGAFFIEGPALQGVAGIHGVVYGVAGARVCHRAPGVCVG